MKVEIEGGEKPPKQYSWNALLEQNGLFKCVNGDGLILSAGNSGIALAICGNSIMAAIPSIWCEKRFVLATETIKIKN